MKIYHRYDLNKVIYEDKEAKTIKECVENAIQNGFLDLKYADLCNCFLAGIDFKDVELEWADLRFSNLIYSNFKYSNLKGANLANSNLRHADFSNACLKLADLRYVDLHNAIGNNKEIQTIQTKEYTINIVKYFNTMQIGCKSNTFDQWFNFTDKEIIALGGKEGLQFWKKWKPILQQILEISYD